MLHNIAIGENARKTQEMARIIDKLVRYEYFRRREVVTLSEEISFAEIFMDIFKARFGEKLEYKKSICEESADCYLPHFSVMAFVKNALSHGFEPKEGEWKLELTVEKEDGNVIIRISDNGTGFDTSTLDSLMQEKKAEYGSICDIITRLREFYGKEEVVSIHSRPGSGTKIKIELPL